MREKTLSNIIFIKFIIYNIASLETFFSNVNRLAVVLAQSADLKTHLKDS